jgi:hypothetical protein
MPLCHSRRTDRPCGPIASEKGSLHNAKVGPFIWNLVEEAECLDMCTGTSIYLLSARIARVELRLLVLSFIILLVFLVLILGIG